MPTKAYILIETDVGKSRDVATELYALNGVTTVDAPPPTKEPTGNKSMFPPGSDHGTRTVAPVLGCLLVAQALAILQMHRVLVVGLRLAPRVLQQHVGPTDQSGAVPGERGGRRVNDGCPREIHASFRLLCLLL